MFSPHTWEEERGRRRGEGGEEGGRRDGMKCVELRQSLSEKGKRGGRRRGESGGERCGWRQEQCGRRSGQSSVCVSLVGEPLTEGWYEGDAAWSTGTRAGLLSLLSTLLPP